MLEVWGRCQGKRRSLQRGEGGEFTLNIENNSLSKIILNFNHEGYLKIGRTKEAIGFGGQHGKQHSNFRACSH